jgi:ATP-dependent DNA ligase
MGSMKLGWMIDGEVIAIDETGCASFNALQHKLSI